MGLSLKLVLYYRCRGLGGRGCLWQVFDGGDIEYKYLGPHQDVRKTKELQDQGKKINLSLSEVIIIVILVDRVGIMP